MHDEEVLRWERAMPHGLRTNLTKAAAESVMLPTAPVRVQPNQATV